MPLPTGYLIQPIPGSDIVFVTRESDSAELGSFRSEDLEWALKRDAVEQQAMADALAARETL